MYNTIFTHLVYPDGQIALEMPEESVEFALFLAHIIEDASTNLPQKTCNTEIDCFNPKCNSNIIAEFVEEGEKIWWYCPECEEEGIISEWKGSLWDNSSRE